MSEMLASPPLLSLLLIAVISLSSGNTEMQTPNQSCDPACAAGGVSWLGWGAGPWGPRCPHELSWQKWWDLSAQCRDPSLLLPLPSVSHLSAIVIFSP